MLPFLELEIVIVNNEQKSKKVIAPIQPSQIEYYYPAFYEGSIVVMKSGQSFMTTVSKEQLDSALVEYSKVLKANAGKFGNVTLTTKKAMHVTN